MAMEIQDKFIEGIMSELEKLAEKLADPEVRTESNEEILPKLFIELGTQGNQQQAHEDEADEQKNNEQAKNSLVQIEQPIGNLRMDRRKLAEQWLRNKGIYEEGSTKRRELVCEVEKINPIVIKTLWIKSSPTYEIRPASTPSLKKLRDL